MMKKLLLLLLTLVMLFGCTAVAETTTVDYTGVWTLTSLEAAGVTMDMTMLAQMGMDMTMAVNADGTMFTTTMGVTEHGTWVVTEQGIAITDDEETIEIAYVNDTLRIEEDGAAMILTRGELAAQTEAAVQVDANAADFDYAGSWIITGVEMLGMTMDAETVGVSGDMALYEDGVCVLTMMDESQEGTWAVTETGITTTDAEGVVDTYTLVNGQLVAEQDGMKIIFDRYAPRSGLTVADFNGEWVFEYAEVCDYANGTQDFYEAADFGLSMTLSLADGKGQATMTSQGQTDVIAAECIVEEVEDFGSVMYMMFLDENGAQDGTGMMLIMYPEDELTWNEYDSEADVEYYYNFIRKAE